MRGIKNINETLPEPNRVANIPIQSQWLSGEGAGSWFYIEKSQTKNAFRITRYSPTGLVECESNFEINNSFDSLDIDKPFRFVHLSHCAFVHVEQNNKIIKLNRIIKNINSADK